MTVPDRQQGIALRSPRALTKQHDALPAHRLREKGILLAITVAVCTTSDLTGASRFNDNSTPVCRQAGRRELAIPARAPRVVVSR